MKGSPIISFKWFKNEMEVNASPKHRLDFTDLVASLEIVNCTVQDSGDYVCVASSDAGSDRCSSTLTIKGWFTDCSLCTHQSLVISFSSIPYEYESYCDILDTLIFLQFRWHQHLTC